MCADTCERKTLWNQSFPAFLCTFGIRLKSLGLCDLWAEHLPAWRTIVIFKIKFFSSYHKMFHFFLLSWNYICISDVVTYFLKNIYSLILFWCYYKWNSYITSFWGHSLRGSMSTVDHYWFCLLLFPIILYKTSCLLSFKVTVHPISQSKTFDIFLMIIDLTRHPLKSWVEVAHGSP